MTAQEMWNAYTRLNPEAANRNYEAWPFGGGSPEGTNLLAELTLRGVKTATASACACYQAENEPLPQPGDYSVILDAAGEAVCVICTTRVSVTPFARVTPEHAWLEGEDDRSLEAWRVCHRKFFTMELEALGQTFTEDMQVVCEEFRRVYPQETEAEQAYGTAKE